MNRIEKLIAEIKAAFFTAAKAKRDLRRKRAAVHTEAVEPRLLLAADLTQSLYDTTVMRDVADDLPIESYFVKFDAPQSELALEASAGAAAVVASEYVQYGYEFTFDSGLTMQSAANVFTALPNFEYLHPDLPVDFQTEAVPNDPLYANQWHFNNTGQTGGLVGADSNIQGVWDNYTGTGVTVAIVDTGLETGHEDFVGNINTTIDRDFVDNDDDPNPGVGENHGTAVGGIVAARGNNGVGVTGAAWDAELVSLRLLGGQGTTSATVADALSHESQQIDVYNNSWGIARGGLTRTGDPRVLAAIQQGATQGRGGLGNVYVWSNGNGALQNTNGNYRTYSKSRHTIAVGALLDDGTRAAYSNPGATTIISAYADPVTTTDLTGAAGYDASNYTSTFNGTSSAAPHVSGIIALMLDANPNLTYRDVVDILVHTGERVDASHGDWVQNGAGLWVNHEYGFGGIDASAAVDAALTHTTLLPEQTYTTGTQTVLADIPDNGAAVTRTVNVPADENLRLEYVEVVFNATHTFIGDLEVVLTSPSGTESVLAESRIQDGATNYNNYVFMSARHWDEFSAGDWTISVRDGQAQDVGTFDSFEFVFYGTPPTGLIVNETNGDTVVADFQQSDTLTVNLAIQPTSDVVVNVTPRDTSEVAATPATLTFTPANFAIPQTVDVSGVLDLAVDGDQTTDLIIAIDTVRSDPFYANEDPQVISVTSIDNDGFLPGKPTVTAPIGLVTTTRPEITWTVVNNALDYEVVVRNVFTDAVVQQTTVRAATSVTLPVPFADGVYSVTVGGVNTDGQPGPISDPVIFGIGEIQDPGAPVITSPTQGATVATAQPPIVWNAVANAIQYELYIRTQDGVTRVTDPGTPLGNGTSLEYITATDFPEGDVTVWIRSIDPFGGMSDWSAPVRFTVNAVEIPSIPIITSPLVDVTTNPFPRFSWVGDGDSYELWVSQKRAGTGTQQVPAVFDRVIYLRGHRDLDYTHFNPLANADHRAWVRATNSAGEKSAWSRVEEFTVAVPTPATPNLAVAVPAGGLRPSFTWQSSGDAYVPGTTFDLWVNNLSTGQSRVIRDTTLTGSSFTPDADLGQGRYRAWIRSSTALGVNSGWSSPVTFDIDLAAPERPTMIGPVAATGAASTSIITDLPTFAWTAGPAAVRFELWVNNVTTGASRIVHETQLTETSYTPETPVEQGLLRAWVRAYNEAGEVGEWSRPFSFTVDILSPTTPVITAPVPNAVGTVSDATPTFRWTASAGSVVSYDLQLDDTTSSTRLLNLRGIEETEYTVENPLAEASHQARVRGVNSAGETSPWSDWFTFTIDVPNATTPVPVTPVGTVTTSSVTFEWQHAAENISYEILVRDLLRQESIVIQMTTSELGLGTDTETAVFTRDGFADGTYRWWVRAFNTQGTASSWSTSQSFNVDAQAKLDLDQLLKQADQINIIPARTEAEPNRKIAVEVPVATAADSDRIPSDFDSSLRPRQTGAGAAPERLAEEIAAVMVEFADPAAKSPFLSRNDVL